MKQIQLEYMQNVLVTLESQGFEELTIAAIDQTLTKLGVKVKQAFYYFLETQYNLDKEDIPARIDDFIEALETLFGASAALVEIEILKNLQNKIPSFTFLLKKPNLSLSAYLASLRLHVEKVDHL